MGAGCPAGLAVENAARPCSRCAEPGSPLKMTPSRVHGVLDCSRRHKRRPAIVAVRFFISALRFLICGVVVCFVCCFKFVDGLSMLIVD